MANSKISALPSGSPPQAADEFPIARAATTTFKVTWAQMCASPQPIGSATPSTGAFTTGIFSGIVNIGSAASPSPFTQLGLGISTDTAVGQTLILRKSASTNNNHLIAFLRSRGTAASPTALVAGDAMGGISAVGYNAVTANYASAGYCQWTADSIDAGGVPNTRFALATSNAGVQTERLLIAADGTTTIPGTTALGGTSTVPSLRADAVASNANTWRFVGSTAGNVLIVEAVGTDTNIGISYYTKNIGTHNFCTGGGRGGEVQFQISDTVGATRHVYVTGSNGGNPVIGVSAGSLRIPNPVDLSAATAGQIQFPATQNPSADVNTLDDYEERQTFTPTITFGGASVGVTYSTQAGEVTKIGNQVFGEIRITLTNKGSSVGAIRIAGLPYTARNTFGVGVCNAFVIAGGSGLTNLAATYVEANLTTIALNSQTATSTLGLTDANVTNSFDILLSFTYLT